MPPEQLFPQQLITPFMKAAMLYAADLSRSSQTASVLFVVKAAAFVSIVLMVAGIIALIIKMNLFSDKRYSIKGFLKPRTGAKADKYVKELDRIRERLERQSEVEDRLAIIEADRLLDGALKDIGYSGKSLAERLQNLKPWHIGNIQDVWDAHKLRNRIVHEPGARLSHYDAETAVKIYEKALKDLGLIE